MGKPQITALPLDEKDRIEFIAVANDSFEKVLELMEPTCPDSTRKLWNAEMYVDNLLQENMLPIDREYALSLVDTFLVGHVVALASNADEKLGVSPLPTLLSFEDSDFEFGGQAAIKCDIEINIETGKTHQDVLKSTAEALRKIATQIEADELDDGFHPIKTPNGEKIGEVYLDQYEVL